MTPIQSTGPIFDPADVLPDLCVEHVLSFLSMKDACSCSQLSREWEKISSTSQKWKQFAMRVDIEQAENYRVAVGETLNGCLRTVKASDPVLNNKVWTAAQFDEIAFQAMALGKDPMTEETTQALSDKLGYHDQLNDGIQAHLILNNAGFSRSKSMLMEYAKALEQSYGDEKGYVLITKTHIQAKRFDDAEKLLDEGLLSSSCDTITILELFISAMAREQMLSRAFEICEKISGQLGSVLKRFFCVFFSSNRGEKTWLERY